MVKGLRTDSQPLKRHKDEVPYPTSDARPSLDERELPRVLRRSRMQNPIFHGLQFAGEESQCLVRCQAVVAQEAPDDGTVRPTAAQQST
jgi:hypothetical protein